MWYNPKKSKVPEKGRRMTKDEEIMGMLRKLNAMSRRSRPPHDVPPPPMGEMMPPPPPREHGRVRLMNMLKENGELSQKEIAEKLDIRPQSLSELLVKMESDGFISRRQDKDDKRVIVVALTEKGEEQLVVLRQANREHAEKLFSPLTEEEKDALIAILKKLTQKEDK